MIEIEQQEKILPVYIVIDVSLSTSPALGMLSNELRALFETLRENPIVADLAWIGVCTFSNAAEQILPLSQVNRHISFPDLRAGGNTSYSAAFTLLREVISEDVENLKQVGYAVFRPLVFFLTDGAPGDPEYVWREALQALRNIRANPTIVALGVGNADPAILREVAGNRGTAFTYSRAGSLSGAYESLSEWLLTLTTSVAASTTCQEHQLPGTATVVVPDDWIDLSELPE